MAAEKPSQVQGAPGDPGRILAVEALRGGEMPQLDARELPDAALSEAINCCYKNGRLFVGRPGLASFLSGLGGKVLQIATAISKGSLFVRTAQSLYSVSGSSATPIATVAQEDAWIVGFKNWLAICDGGPLRLWDGTSMWQSGTCYDGTSDVDANSIVLWGTVASGQAAGVHLASWSVKRRLFNVRVYLAKESGVTAGTVRCKIWQGNMVVATAVESISHSALGTSPSEHEFTFAPYDVAASAGNIYVAVYADGFAGGNLLVYKGAGDATDGDGVPATFNGSAWTDQSGFLVAMAINGTDRPRPTRAIVAQSRLFVADGATIYWSAPGDPFDFFSAGGFFTFGDDDSSQVEAMTYDDAVLYVSGMSRGDYCTISYYMPTTADLSERTTLYHAAVCPNGLFVYNDTLYIVGRDFVGASVPVDVADREIVANLSFQTIAQSSLADGVSSAIDRRNGWLLLKPASDGTDIHVMELPKNTETPAGPWTRFRFPSSVICSCISSVGDVIYVGTTDGNVHKLTWDNVKDFGTTLINCGLITKRFDFGSILHLKTVKGVRLDCSASRRVRLKVVLYGENETQSEVAWAYDSINARTRMRTRTLRLGLTTPDNPDEVEPVWLGKLFIWYLASGVEAVGGQ